ncbi:hypothetical protein PANDA_017562 [Ailuropoda melanoleuca]|uniref:LIM zinc-binding domain-containing protein n=1 Tax=Ailuropoda melanoleuca TaxID=9646 RepID=D2HY11_AILME|nr:hypothetical protein PANDA_017562 [Ailuropoda melanoleuca]
MVKTEQPGNQAETPATSALSFVGAYCGPGTLLRAGTCPSSNWPRTHRVVFPWLGVQTRRTSNMSNALANAVCQRCQVRFAPAERIVNSNGELYHEHCFVCAQCFRPFPEGLFYEALPLLLWNVFFSAPPPPAVFQLLNTSSRKPFPEGELGDTACCLLVAVAQIGFEGRKYCEHDFQMLFAPCCGSCGEFIIGRVIKAMNNNWHPGCFRCELCDVELADLGFVKNAGRSRLTIGSEEEGGQRRDHQMQWMDKELWVITTARPPLAADPNHLRPSLCPWLNVAGEKSLSQGAQIDSDVQGTPLISSIRLLHVVWYWSWWLQATGQEPVSLST